MLNNITKNKLYIIFIIIIIIRLPQPPKMRITEEKVAASLRDMHISNEFKAQNYWFNSNPCEMDVCKFY